MKSIISLLSISCLLLTLCLAGCKGAAEHSPGRTITVSIAPLSGMAAAIAGEQYGISTLMPDGMSPETYELTPGRVLELGNCSLLLRVGSLGFEQTLTERLGGAMPATRIVSLGSNIEKLEDKDCDHASGEDPHLWMSPRNMQTCAKRFAKPTPPTPPPIALPPAAIKRISTAWQRKWPVASARPRAAPSSSITPRSATLPATSACGR